MHRAPRAHQQLIILHCLSHAEIVRNALLSVLVFCQQTRTQYYLQQ